MNKYILSAIAFLLMLPAAQAADFAGNYQLLNKQGEVLYEGWLKLETEVIDADTSLHIYTEPTANGLVKTVCDVSKKYSKLKPLKVVEDCEGYGISTMECIGQNCKGSIEFESLTDEKNSIIEKNSAKKRIQMITLKQPIDYLGLKGVYRYVHVLNRK